LHRIDTPGNVGGLFVPPNPMTGQQPVLVDSPWLNDVQENLCNLITGAGIALVKGNYNQLLAAVEYFVGHISGAAGTERQFAFETAGLLRWIIAAGAAAEAGGNAGSDLNFTRYNDAGVYIDTPLQIIRSNGIAHFGQSPVAPTPATSDNSTKLATTAFVAAQLASSLGAAGWQKIGPLALQWGSVVASMSEGTQDVTFPEAFNSTCYGAFAIALNSDNNSTRDIWMQTSRSPAATASGARFMVQMAYGSPLSTIGGFNWFAIGDSP